MIRFVVLLMVVSLGAFADAPDLRTEPLMRGTLWWMSSAAQGSWTRAQFEQAIDEQHAVGFDVLWVLNTPDLFQHATAPDATGDPLAVLFDVADEKNMHVIVDLPKGGWYGTTPAEAMAAELSTYAEAFFARYGSHASFYGWYLNHEINPIAPGDAQQTAYWRSVWKEAASACHRVAPKSVVTISPFFMMDSQNRRGFIYQTPERYAEWWGATLKETHIDILMLQDSGAEHLSFFTLADREPFFAAMRKACDAAGAQFWVNVETGEALVANWDEFIALEREKKVPWRFTPIEWLEQKLRLAAQYGDGIINWGYFPFMDPAGGTAKPEALAAYNAYKAYVQRVRGNEEKSRLEAGVTNAGDAESVRKQAEGKEAGHAAVASVRIDVPSPVSPVMENIAAVATRHIAKRCAAQVVRSGDAAYTVELAIDPGLPREGFEIADTAGGVRITGADEHSVLYGVGKFLRVSTYKAEGLVPGAWRGKSAPEGSFRAVYAATHFNNFYEAAPADEVSRYLEDLALWGANTVIVHFPTWSFAGFDDPAARKNIEQTRRLLLAAKAIGMKAGLVQCPNQGFASAPESVHATPNADQMKRRGNTGINCCPSKPAGKAYLLALYAGVFAEYKDFGLDYLICWPYDEGGCGCAACAPWGAKAFPLLSKDVATLGRAVFPELNVILSTWVYDLPPEGEWEGLAALLEQDHAWLNAIMCDDHLDFPRYPLDHGVPAGLPLYNFPEISMWGRNPWGGFGANPLPNRYERLWKQTEGKLSGGMPYSEGIFEDMNKAICFQFYWNRTTAAEDTLREYAAYEFSPESAETVLAAVRLLEAAWVERGPKSLEAFTLLKDIDTTLPAWARTGWRWRIVYLRGLIDSELVSNGGKMEGAVLRDAFNELTAIYHAENAHEAVKPQHIP